MRTRMSGGVGAGRSILPATRLGPFRKNGNDAAVLAHENGAPLTEHRLVAFVSRNIYGNHLNTREGVPDAIVSVNGQVLSPFKVMSCSGDQPAFMLCEL